MGLTDDNLLSGEQLVYKTSLHIIVFITPLLAYLTCLGLMFMGRGSLSVAKAHNLIFYFSIFLLLYSVYQFIIYQTAEITLTNKRILAKRGILAKSYQDIFLDKVESISVDQEIMGRILGYGTVVVRGTGGTPEKFTFIANPLELRNQLQKTMP